MNGNIIKISHIAVVVPDLEEALEFWEKTLGLPLEHIEHVQDQEVDVAFLPSGESEIELLEPISKASGVARYMEKRGPGLHHICFEVDDIEAMMAAIKAAGLPMIDEHPRIGTGGKKIAFVHPRGTGGVLVELYQLTPDEPERRRERMDDMRQRLSQGTRVYRAGLTAFISGLRTGSNGDKN